MQVHASYVMIMAQPKGTHVPIVCIRMKVKGHLVALPTVPQEIQLTTHNCPPQFAVLHHTAANGRQYKGMYTAGAKPDGCDSQKLEASTAATQWVQAPCSNTIARPDAHFF